MKILTLRIEGAMQSWGNSSYETRGTEDFPTQRGILGLIGSAMGYSRENPDFLKKVESLTTAFRIDARGKKLRDYQTIAISKPGAKISKKIVEKFYLADASFLVAVYDPQDQNAQLLLEIEQALKKPANTLFLGRKAYPPSTRIFDDLKDYASLRQAFERIPAPRANHDISKKTTVLDAWIPGDSGKSQKLINDIPISFSTNHRQYSSRIISRIEIELENITYQEPLKTTDIFNMIGD